MSNSQLWILNFILAAHEIFSALASVSGSNQPTWPAWTLYSHSIWPFCFYRAQNLVNPTVIDKMREAIFNLHSSYFKWSARQWVQGIHSLWGMCELTHEGNNETRHGVIHSFTASPFLSTYSVECKNAGCVLWNHIISRGYYIPKDPQEKELKCRCAHVKSITKGCHITLQDEEVKWLYSTPFLDILGL